MNIEVFNLASEETLISLAVFSGAFFFLIYQKISSLKKQILCFEESEISSRDSPQRDMNRVNTVIEDLKYEYVDTEKNIERQLVELEMGNLTLQPKIKDFYKKLKSWSVLYRYCLTMQQNFFILHYFPQLKKNGISN